MSRKKWVVKPYDKEDATAIAEALGVSPYAALIASTRGIKTPDEAREFFGMSEENIVDPYFFPDMEKAVSRIRTALDEFERIAVYGDYDADGVTATSLLYSYLEMQGADVVYYVPDRHTEGYGLSFEAVDKISRMGAKLIITVDNGISAVDEAKYIRNLEMDLIVTDHHLPGDVLPEAIAVVDPHREDCTLTFKDYAGVGVAYKLICALEGGENEITDSYVDLVTIGTIADIMPLKSENRRIVRRGVEMLADSDRIGIQALMEVAGLTERAVTSTSIAFGIVPRINAAGRMGSALRAIKLLICDDYEEAISIAQEIHDDNSSRQQIELDIFLEAVAKIEENPQWIYDPVLVVSGEEWHDGVIGIVASRLVEKYGKPTIVVTVIGDEAKGSGRSIEGFNLYEALKNCESTLTHFGGHKLAAGVGLLPENIDEFRSAINEYAESQPALVPIQNIDFKINPACVNTDLLGVLSTLEPFGAGNTQPVFGLYNMVVSDIQPIGGGKHIRVVLTRGDTSLQVVKFKMTPAEFPFYKNDIVDAAVIIEPNEYLGQLRISILLKNIKLHDMDDDILIKRMNDFTSLMRGGNINIRADEFLPDRNLTASVYKFIRSSGRWNYDIETLCHRLGLSAEYYGKVASAVEALTQLGTLVYDENGGLTLPEVSQKVNLDDAPIFTRIKMLDEISRRIN